jgi:hypothetical protein
MERRIRHHLGRARAAALSGPTRAQTPIAPRIDDVVDALAKIYADKRIALAQEVPRDLAVACEQQDFDEMAGNLLENAFRWARSRVEVHADRDDGRSVAIVIDDDGPGLRPEQIPQVLRPGERLDESAPGFGFGLPITRELAELYGGELKLAASPLGGLRVTLRLPVAAFSQRIPRSKVPQFDKMHASPKSSTENLAFLLSAPIFSAMAFSSQTRSSSQASSSQAWRFDDRSANPTSRQQRLARIDKLATLLDSALVVPGTNIRFGLDAIVGLVPGIGDLVTSLVSLYIVHEARQLGAPTHLLVRMVANIAIDGIVGSAPVAGDIFDVMWRANRRNMTLLYDHLRSKGEFARPVSGTEF